MNQTIQERLTALRREMKKESVDFYIVPTDDYHQSEYVGEYFKERAYITGFTGSAGTALIARDSAYLWTDGRYFLQAADQLEGTGVTLMKMGEPGVPNIVDFLKDHLQAGETLAFDGRCVSKKMGEIYNELAAAKSAYLMTDQDLVGRIWKDRPAMAAESVWVLDTAYAGRSAAEKIADVRKRLQEEEATVQLVAALDDICWMLNIRGNDVAYFPLVLSYCMISLKAVVLYIDSQKLSAEVKEHLKAAGVTLAPYNRIYEDVKKLDPEQDVVLYDPLNMNYALYQCIPDMYVVEMENPQILMKAKKNETELANIRIAQHKDSIAHVRFMKWLKENVAAGQRITEMEASDQLDEFRKAMGNFIEPSFDPISAYGTHGAIIHYSSKPETNSVIEAGGMLLTDTGAGFLEGSTDITRTYALGEIPQIQKEHFTLVAMANMRLAAARFLQGCTGQALDVLARQPLWDRGLNFNHGTGHGVGYLLNIHEDPQAFRYQTRPNDAALEEGMVITDEPGLYIAGSHGIRLENELLVQKDARNEYGQFMHLEILTKIPFDLDAIDPSVMEERDKALLNAYHRDVYESLSPDLTEEEREWLKVYTRAI